MSLVSNLILPPSCFTQMTAPDWFLKQLHDIDWRLIVYFNHLRKRWIVDRCIKGITADSPGGIEHKHDNECTRTNVLVVRGPDGEYFPLNQQVLDWFRANDVGSKYAKPEHYITELATKDEANREKMAADRKDFTHQVTLENKRQLLQAYHLAQQHDLEVNQ